MAGGMFGNRWVLLVACLWVQTCGGNSYNFSIYSAALKERLRYSQTMLDTLASAKDVGGNVGVLSGFLYELLPPWTLLAIGAAQNLIGYGGLWLAVTGIIKPPPLWATSACICLGVNGATFFNTVVLVTCLRTFPAQRGVVVGLLKGFIGLSGAIFTQVYVAAFFPDQTSFLFLIAWLPAAVALLLSPFIHERPPAETVAEQAHETSTFMLLYRGSLLLAGLLLTAMLVRELLPKDTSWSAVLTAVMLVVLASPVIIPLQAWYSERKKQQPGWQSLPETEDSERGSRKSSEEALVHVSREDELEAEGEGHEFVSVAADAEAKLEAETFRSRALSRRSAILPKEEASLNGSSKHPRPARGEDHTLMQAVRGADFWLLFLSQIIGAGCGLTAINNLAQMGSALGQTRSVSMFVGLVNLCSFLGRLAAGAISEHYVRERGVPRPLFLLGGQAIMAAGHLLFASALPGSLYAGSVLAGATYGGQWALMSATASELFGLGHFATLYNWLAVGSPLSTYLLSACLAGFIYDREARRQRGSGHDPGDKGWGIWSIHEERGSLGEGRGPESMHLEGVASDSQSRRDLMGLGQGTAAWAAAAPAPEGPPTCTGAHCFRVTFLSLATVCLLGSALNGWLAWRTKKFYQERWEERKEQAEEQTANVRSTDI